LRVEDDKKLDFVLVKPKSSSEESKDDEEYDDSEESNEEESWDNYMKAHEGKGKNETFFIVTLMISAPEMKSKDSDSSSSEIPPKGEINLRKVLPNIC
jgi:hypothetical protein